jgi:hypothetical protein
MRDWGIPPLSTPCSSASFWGGHRWLAGRSSPVRHRSDRFAARPRYPQVAATGVVPIHDPGKVARLQQ